MPTELPTEEYRKEDKPEADEISSPSFAGHQKRPPVSAEENIENEGPRMRASAANDGNAFRIATIAKIPVRLHWTFFLLLAWVAWGGLAGGPQTGTASAWSLITVLALFACVVLHEFGHALTARHYGIRTRDIVLYPIGGVASLERLPRPRQELWIALAGPAVNLVIAGLMWIGMRLAGITGIHLGTGNAEHSMLGYLMGANLVLAIFNMVPAFPMDGGRVLRALLARGMDELAATDLAARIGQGLAILLGVYSLMHGNYMLLFVAVFVFSGARQEASAFQTRELITGHRVREAMLREFEALSPGMTLRQAADRLLAGSQHDFPVVHGGQVIGILSRSGLLRGLANDGPDAYVSGVMLREFIRVHPDEDLENLLPVIQEAGPMLVMQTDTTSSDDLIGMVTQENMYEFLLLSQAEAHVRRTV